MVTPRDDRATCHSIDRAGPHVGQAARSIRDEAPRSSDDVSHPGGAPQQGVVVGGYLGVEVFRCGAFGCRLLALLHRRTNRLASTGFEHGVKIREAEQLGDPGEQSVLFLGEDTLPGGYPDVFPGV